MKNKIQRVYTINNHQIGHIITTSMYNQQIGHKNTTSIYNQQYQHDHKEIKKSNIYMVGEV